MAHRIEFNTLKNVTKQINLTVTVNTELSNSHIDRIINLAKIRYKWTVNFQFLGSTYNLSGDNLEEYLIEIKHQIEPSDEPDINTDLDLGQYLSVLVAIMNETQIDRLHSRKGN